MSGSINKILNDQEKNNSDHKATPATAELTPEQTIERAMNEMQLRTQAAINMWGLDTASWAADLDEGTITFTNDEKNLVVTAPVQVIGSYNTEDGTWLWGWDHPSVDEPLGEFARRVRAFGEQHGMEELTTRKIHASMDDAWRFTALACHLGGGEGAYAGPADSARFLMVYGPVTISKKE